MTQFIVKKITTKVTTETFVVDAESKDHIIENVESYDTSKRQQIGTVTEDLPVKYEYAATDVKTKELKDKPDALMRDKTTRPAEEVRDNKPEDVAES